MPKWNTISISGYHIREAGSTAVQELAFTFADAIEYVKSALAAGLKVDEFAPRLSFFFASHNNLLEEVAKFRAARRIWARIMKEKFAAGEKSQLMRFHTQTGGVTLTAQQPMNNVVRVTMQALAAVLGGTQSLHTNSMDEALALPTEDSVRVALRTQQIIAYESGVADTVDPLAGSYYVEALTNEIEKRGLEVPGQDRGDGRHAGGHRGRLPAEADPGQLLRLPEGDRQRRAGDRRRQPVPGRRGPVAPEDAQGLARGRGAAEASAWPRQKRSATTRPSRKPWPRSKPPPLPTTT